MAIDTQHSPSINLHIEELILHGFAREGRYAIGGALQNELQRLITEQGLPQVLQEGEVNHLAQLHADNVVVQPGTGAEAIGTQLARSLYAGLCRDKESREGGRATKQVRKDQ